MINQRAEGDWAATHVAILDIELVASRGIYMGLEILTTIRTANVFIDELEHQCAPRQPVQAFQTRIMFASYVSAWTRSGYPREYLIANLDR